MKTKQKEDGKGNSKDAISLFEQALEKLKKADRSPYENKFPNMVKAINNFQKAAEQELAKKNNASETINNLGEQLEYLKSKSVTFSDEQTNYWKKEYGVDEYALSAFRYWFEYGEIHWAHYYVFCSQKEVDNGNPARSFSNWRTLFKNILLDEYNHSFKKRKPDGFLDMPEDIRNLCKKINNDLMLIEKAREYVGNDPNVVLKYIEESSDDPCIEWYLLVSAAISEYPDSKDLEPYVIETISFLEDRIWRYRKAIELVEKTKSRNPIKAHKKGITQLQFELEQFINAFNRLPTVATQDYKRLNDSKPGNITMSFLESILHDSLPELLIVNVYNSEIPFDDIDILKIRKLIEEIHNRASKIGTIDKERDYVINAIYYSAERTLNHFNGKRNFTRHDVAKKLINELGKRKSEISPQCKSIDPKDIERYFSNTSSRP